jgi:hypothetical protein
MTAWFAAAANKPSRRAILSVAVNPAANTIALPAQQHPRQERSANREVYSRLFRVLFSAGRVAASAKRARHLTALGGMVRTFVFCFLKKSRHLHVFRST